MVYVTKYLCKWLISLTDLWMLMTLVPLIKEFLLRYGKRKDLSLLIEAHRFVSFYFPFCIELWVGDCEDDAVGHYTLHSGRCYQHFSGTPCFAISSTQLGLFLIIKYVGIWIIISYRNIYGVFYYIMPINFIWLYVESKSEHRGSSLQQNTDNNLSGYSVAQLRTPHCKHFVGILCARLIQRNFIFNQMC